MLSKEQPTTKLAEEPTTMEKLRGLRWAIASFAANTVFVQFTFFGSVFVLFLDYLGFSKTDIGFLLSFMPFAGLVALFIAPWVARFGYKRTYITFWAMRKFFTAFLLLTPIVISVTGPQVTFLFIGVITAGFGLSRAIAETGRFPWTQEFVPKAVQGKFTAMSNLATTITGLIAVTIAGYVIEHSTGLSGYMWLIGIGVLVGLLSVWLMTFVPGGAPVPAGSPDEKKKRDLGAALTDSNFLRYIAGACLIVIATQPLNSFIPLYMQEQIGLSTGNVVYLQSSTLIASMFTSYLWGWAADRYGSKPVLLSGVLFKILLPLLWLIMPQSAPLDYYAALGIAFLQGVANMGWMIGSTRLLFVGVVPPDKKSDYMALYYACVGVVGGLSQMFSGRLLDLSAGLTGNIGGFQLNAFVPLFLIALLLPFVSLFLFRRITMDDDLSMQEFVGVFFRGNPFMAMTSLVRYQFARDEESTLEATESLGRAHSRLAAEELINALDDPRFNVRLEAILAIARLKPDPRLTKALLEVYQGQTLALSVMAAWALGRMGPTTSDEVVISALRDGLSAPIRTVQAQSARSLGTLGDNGSRETLEALFGEAEERDAGLRMSYASALGKLRAEGAVIDMLDFLHELRDRHIRMEMALALARIIGDEAYFIQLERQQRSDPGTAFAQAVTALRKLMEREPTDTRCELMTNCADALARADLEGSIPILVEVIRQTLERQPPPTIAIILRASADQLEVNGTERIEYLLLALHSLHEHSIN